MRLPNAKARRGRTTRITVPGLEFAERDTQSAPDVELPVATSNPVRSHRLRWRLLSAVAAVVVVGVLVLVNSGRNTGTDNEIATVSPPAESAPPTVAAPTRPVTSIATPTAVGSFSVPAPQALALSPDGRHGLAISGDHQVYSLDLTAAKATPLMYTPLPPRFAAITPDGRRAYISTYGNDLAGVVEVVDTATDVIIKDIPVGLRPFALIATPDGRQVWVPDHDSQTLSVIDTASNTVVATIRVPASPHWITFTPDGRTAFVADHESNLVSVVDVASRTVRATIPVPLSPHCVVVSPDGSQAIVASYDAASISFIDVATLAVTTTAVGQNPQALAFAPDSRHAYVADYGSNTVSVVDTATRQVTATIAVGVGPDYAAVAQDGRRAYVADEDSDSVSMLDVGSRQ
ncbi:MAG: beta-propeller fold lactonase family protein [Nocardia sp.]|nr:beta-propeller fold lactonase family protein [Nocardia sp.]